MQNQIVSLSVPAEAKYARLVRMTAANLGVLCGLSVDDVEDLRMIAEEGFVYGCSTRPESLEVSFAIADGVISIDLPLGDGEVDEGSEDLSLVELLLGAVCDEFLVTDEGVLHLTKQIGDAHA